ncbi:hypothetical protein PS838_05251 [Pseudomonas fluorescens]|nr:hypothetical protein PS838_05251 [Pseudomonas fluorescens]
MDVNEDGGRLDVRGALSSFASRLAPTNSLRANPATTPVKRIRTGEPYA